MADKTDYLTKEKFDELSRELEHLKTVRRKEVAENLEYAKSLGDLSENAEYHEARETQANVEDRIAKLEAMLKSAVIMEMRHTDTVDVGSTVTLFREKDGKRYTYKVVGSEEADLASGRISLHSPLGEAMIGKQKGDRFSVRTPGGVTEYAVTAIE